MEKEKTTWEVKDRNYYLLHGKTPLTYTITSKHTRRFPLLWFDEEQGRQRELRYATNQSSPFVDEQNGQVTLEHIVFNDGALHVPKEKQSLQKLLSLYHPMKGKRFAEINNVETAKDEIEDIELEIYALTAAQGIEIEQAEAILRVEQGSSVSNLSSKEIKRDILIFAKNNPRLFIDLANDENVILRNFAIKAVELGIMKLDADQRTFKWGSNGRKLMTVPFEENPYSAMAAYFKTDEGLQVYKSIEKKIS
ncbi:MAG: hypothetical protein GY787_14720 [Alteromonadales bacterium]|jgi:hypothetical protein|nr:hypothetical protein [Alteromonadales bacterium]